MLWRKIFLRTLTALLIVAGLLSAAIVGAAIQIFDGQGQWHTNDDDNQQIAMARAQQRAQLNAQEKAGVYLKTFSRSVNAMITDDEISAVTQNIIEIVGEVHFDKKIIPLSDTQTTILYTATLKARIDPDGIFDFIKRDNRDKATIVAQNNPLQEAIRKNDELAASLVEQYNRATTQAERDRIRKQMNDADREFLANQKFEEGNRLVYAKDYDGAIKFYNEAIELKPDWSWPYNNRGNAYDELRQYDFAFADYDKALEFKQHELIYYNRGNTYNELGQYGSAIADYDKAIELKPDYFDAYNNRGCVYANQQQYERAIADFNKAIELNPNDAEAYNNRGIVYVDLKQYERAIADYDKAIALNPNYAYAYNNRGNAYNDIKQYESAIADYNKAIELKPDYFEAYYNRGNAYFNQQQYDLAIADYSKAIELKPNLANAYNNRGAAYAKLKQYERAIADYSKAIELKPDYVYAYNNRGWAYQKLGQYERAIEDYDKAIELKPDYALAYGNRGESYYYLKNYTQAFADLNKAIDMGLEGKDLGEVLYYRGLCYQQLGDEAKAQADFARAKELGYNG